MQNDKKNGVNKKEITSICKILVLDKVLVCSNCKKATLVRGAPDIKLSGMQTHTII
jgi:hypothetical protein